MKLICIDCDVPFEWDESPPEDRCAHCASIRQWQMAEPDEDVA